MIDDQFAFGTAGVTPEVSVVVPAFNAGPYIDECLSSLLRQEIALQIVVVDDGSTDDTAERVRAMRPTGGHTLLLIQQNNGGLSAARNTGLRAATGSFIGFVDADDWIQDEMYGAMLNAARANAADLVVCGGLMIDHHTRESYPFQDRSLFHELLSRQTGAFDPQTEPKVFRLDTSACRRLYSRDLLRRTNFSFAEGLLFEDVLAHYCLLLSTRALCLVRGDHYRYRVNHAGRITDRRDLSVLTVFEILAAVSSTLHRAGATDDIWVNFIWQQDWVLRWLVTQVDGTHQAEFLDRAVRLASTFPPTAIVSFQQMLDQDVVAQRAVLLQLLGFPNTYMRNAEGSLPDYRVARLDRLKPLPPSVGRRRRRS